MSELVDCLICAVILAVFATAAFIVGLSWIPEVEPGQPLTPAQFWYSIIGLAIILIAATGWAFAILFLLIGILRFQRRKIYGFSRAFLSVADGLGRLRRQRNCP